MNRLRNMRSKVKLLACQTAIASLMFTTACMPEGAVKKVTAFADGMETVLNNTVQVYELIEEKHLARKELILINEYRQNPAAISNFTAKPFFSQEVLQQRSLVIEGLQRYALNLKTVVGNEKLSEFDDSTKALGAQLKSLNAASVKNNLFKESPLSDAEISLFVTAVNTIGRWFIEYKREKVTRKAIREMNSAVRDAFTLLAKDMGEAPYNADGSPKLGAVGLRKKLWKTYTDLVIERNQYLQANYDSLTPAERVDEVKFLARLTIERRKTDDTLVSIKEALEAVPVAHQILEKAFDEKDSTLGFHISAIFAEAERIKAFYEDMKKN